MIKRLRTFWLTRFFATLTLHRSSRSCPRRPGYHPQLEILEARAVPSFVSAKNTALAASPRYLAVGDFNHDGKLDIVAANQGSTGLVDDAGSYEG